MSDRPAPFLDRRQMLTIIAGICMVNGIFSPYIAIALQIAPILMPEMFPRTIGWALFFSSIIVSTGTLLLGGLPAALYERFVPSDAGLTSMWVWLAAATFLTYPALDTIGRMMM